ncbi:4'-phosphopantetheinyl transferase superfamily protein [Pasteurellaceae bacterium LIM206]|nr:4'-phosphopantetheinyl transferase superfamily protein [Pasteurellaceae bacterium LIM206]
MATLIAWGNVRQDYPLHLIPSSLLTADLLAEPQGNTRVMLRHRSRWIAHFLLWELFKTLDLDTALLAEIYRTRSGRPELAAPSIDFNITHSGDWVAVILNVIDTGAESAVGIDIEAPKRERNFTALLSHFAPAREQRWLARQPNRAQAFYRCWCLREAVLKSQGVGIVKLHEVEHRPTELLLKSAYCPPGTLIFTHELPFYLAVFAAGEALQQACFFEWKNESGLHTVHLKQADWYLVNP